MVITCKCGDESTFFESTDGNVTVESEATSGNIEIINNTKVECTSNNNVKIVALNTSTPQCVIGNKSISKIVINEVSSNANTLYTTAIVINSICIRDIGSNDRTDQLPSATSLVNDINNCQVGSSFHFILRNISTTNILTLATAMGGITLTDVATVPSSTSSHWLFVVTDVGTPTIVGYLINKLSIVITPPAGNDIESIDITNGYLTVTPAAPTSFPTYRAAQGTGAVGDRWTISMWAKQLSGSPADSELMYIQHQDPVISNINLLSILYMNTQKIRFLYGNATAAIKRETATDTFVDNVWHHLMITYDGGETAGADPIATYAAHFKIFIDGVEPSTTDTKIGGGAVDAFPAERVSFGQGPMSIANDFTGRIDQLAIFNGDQSAAINDIYNSTVLPDLSSITTPPAHWWKISSTTDSFPTMTDSIGSDNLTATSLVVGDYSNDIPPQRYNSMSVSNGTLTLSGLTSGFPMRRENNNGTDWTFTMYFRANSSIAAGDYDLLVAGLITLKYNRGNKNIYFTYGDATNWIRKTTLSNSIVDDTWHQIIIRLENGNLGTNGSKLNNYYARMRIYINGVESTVTTSNSNNGINPATNQFTSMTIGSDIGHIAWITIDNNLRQGNGITNIYNGGVPSDLSLLSNVPEFWWQFKNTDTSPNIAPTIGSGNLVLSSGNFVYDVYIGS